MLFAEFTAEATAVLADVSTDCHFRFFVAWLQDANLLLHLPVNGVGLFHTSPDMDLNGRLARFGLTIPNHGQFFGLGLATLTDVLTTTRQFFRFPMFGLVLVIHLFGLADRLVIVAGNLFRDALHSIPVADLWNGNVLLADRGFVNLFFPSDTFFNLLAIDAKFMPASITIGGTMHVHGSAAERVQGF